jgi:phage terminase large subunit-like protein
MRPALEKAGIEVDVIPANKVAAACGLMFTKITTGAMRHLGQKILTDAIGEARKREVGDGMWAFARKRSTGNITPLYAITLAGWAMVDEDGTGEFAVFGASLDLCDNCQKKPHEDPDGENDYLCEDCRDDEPEDG